MRLREALGVCSLLIVLPVAGAAQGGAQGASATAELKDAKGQTVGHAELQDGAKGMVIRLHLMASVPGERAIHIHQIGKCDPPTFQSAGAHLNPANVAHGILSDKGAHAGDLPNVHMAATAMTDVQLFAPGVTLATLLDSDGAALVLHAKPDDYRTDPAGNAGDRIACGTVSKR